MVTIAIDEPLAGGVVAVAAALCAYYGWRVVPAMRAKARAARSTRAPRRPGRRPEDSGAQ
jgi:hypothetical protein